MESVEHSMETVAKKVGELLQADVELTKAKAVFDKKRTVDICTAGHSFVCTLDLDISFENLAEDGCAQNQAEILLLPEEIQPFLTALNTPICPFPTSYQQWMQSNPNLASVCLEAWEPPDQFAERLAIALNILES